MTTGKINIQLFVLPGFEKTIYRPGYKSSGNIAALYNTFFTALQFPAKPVKP